MIARAANVLMAGIVAACLAACASTPVSRFYTLSTVDTPASPPSDTSVSIGPVSVSALLDRPQIVVTAGANQVMIDEFNRWASPLQDNLANVVAGNLVTMIGTPRVTLFPQSAPAGAAYRVSIDVQSLEFVPGKATRLDAVWSIRRTTDDSLLATRRSTTTENVQGSTYDAMVAAQSRAVARMSREIADAIQALSKNTP